MKNTDKQVLIKAGRFVIGLGEAREKLFENHDLEGVELVVEGWTSERGGGFVPVPSGHDEGPGGLLEDPRKALGEDFGKLRELVDRSDKPVGLAESLRARHDSLAREVSQAEPADVEAKIRTLDNVEMMLEDAYGLLNKAGLMLDEVEKFGG